jgi:predicted anti-sigma-YlaC factor YlaD
MRELANNLSCEEFQARFPDLIGSGEEIANHPHLQSCKLCRDLFADLGAIAQAARQLFFVEDPPSSLWAHIKSAIVKEERVTSGNGL